MRFLPLCSDRQLVLKICAGFCALSFFASIATAASGDPLAIRRLDDGAIRIETHWDLAVVIATASSESIDEPSGNVLTVGRNQMLRHQFFRKPNVAESSLVPLGDNSNEDENGITVISTVIAPPDSATEAIAKSKTGDVTALPASGKSVPAIMIRVDGVTIGVVDAESFSANNPGQLAGGEQVDVWVVSFRKSESLHRSGLVQFLNSSTAGLMILNPREEALAVSDLPRLTDSLVPGAAAHGIVAVSADQFRNSDSDRRLVVLPNSSPGMPEPLASLFERMETSCLKSQAVFRDLSVEQLNWRPPNGTHTPRWNTEHMMGRQLLFFSQIYHAIDPAIPVMNLNPSQMPDDYQFAHADWSGAEEALQTQRVSSFVRRFSYLLYDLDVDKRAPGSRWPSLKSLLLQMERHYKEHTDNTMKKFDLPSWPKGENGKNSCTD